MGAKFDNPEIPGDETTALTWKQIAVKISAIPEAHQNGIALFIDADTDSVLCVADIARTASGVVNEGYGVEWSNSDDYVDSSQIILDRGDWFAEAVLASDLGLYRKASRLSANPEPEFILYRDGYIENSFIVTQLKFAESFNKYLDFCGEELIRNLSDREVLRGFLADGEIGFSAVCSSSDFEVLLNLATVEISGFLEDKRK